MEKRTALCLFARGTWQETEEEEEEGPSRTGEVRQAVWEGFPKGHCYFLGGIKRVPVPLLPERGCLEGYGTSPKLRLDVLLGYRDGSANMGNEEDYSVGEHLSPAL